MHKNSRWDSIGFVVGDQVIYVGADTHISTAYRYRVARIHLSHANFPILIVAYDLQEGDRIPRIVAQHLVNPKEIHLRESTLNTLRKEICTKFNWRQAFQS